MATVTFTLSAADLTRMVDALGLRWGYIGTLPDGTPGTKGEFVRLKIAQWVKGEVHQHDLNTAQAAVSVTDIAVT